MYEAAVVGENAEVPILGCSSGSLSHKDVEYFMDSQILAPSIYESMNMFTYIYFLPLTRHYTAAWPRRIFR
jgi:hypothetical protein